MKGIIKKIIPLAPRDIGEAGGYRSILLRDGTAVLGGKIHGETYNLAVKAGFPEDEIGAGIAGFTRPDGTTWDLHGKFGKAKRVVFVEDQPWKQTRTGIRLNRDIDLAIKAAMGAVAGGMMLAPDEAEAMSMKPLRDVITKMGVAAPVGAVLAEQLARKREMERKWEGGGLKEAINPAEYLIPARWGGGAINMAVDALLNQILGE